MTVVIPIKGLEGAKSRLGDRLLSAERSALVLQVLDHVLTVVRASDVAERCVVVSSDPVVRARVDDSRAIAMDEAVPGAGQNAALEHARAAMRRWNPSALLVLSGDLPLLAPRDVLEMGRLGAEQGTVVLGPDRHGIGTNALLLHPPELIPFRFGPDSYHEHTREALARGLRIEVYRGRGIAFDLDLPEDLDLIQRLGKESATADA
jgi:2-phospho-L-lactate guanylyltransferase